MQAISFNLPASCTVILSCGRYIPGAHASFRAVGSKYPIFHHRLFADVCILQGVPEPSDRRMRLLAMRFLE
jgi:hypothetical protein